MAKPAAPVAAVSDPIKLSPGLTISDQVITEARVRLLTRGDTQAARREKDEVREDFLLARQIASLGPIEDQTLIRAAIEFLTVPDDARLRNAIVELEAKYFLAPTREAEREKALQLVCDIVSDEFALNPGITIEGRPMLTARVRLLTRGQWRAVNLEAEDERDDATLFYALAAIGGEIPQREWLAHLVDVDIDRINAAIERLREQHAPVPKSHCPICGNRLEASELADAANDRGEDLNDA